ncbi:hypothetical protein llap_10815 [Limosa lapponica baueri]|uniref:Uncharacterized protein n=1 Tax=Limosa lapponica baueri TaxID=1758121 RepID=A0A2I0TYN7_LIMLA|nr:hypothetical protein llap_10815 [Limosa lapponica baueri]
MGTGWAGFCWLGNLSIRLCHIGTSQEYGQGEAGPAVSDEGRCALEIEKEDEYCEILLANPEIGKAEIYSLNEEGLGYGLQKQQVLAKFIHCVVFLLGMTLMPWRPNALQHVKMNLMTRTDPCHQYKTYRYLQISVKIGYDIIKLLIFRWKRTTAMGFKPDDATTYSLHYNREQAPNSTIVNH